MSTSDSEQYNLLDQLADEFAARFRRGERPALKEYTDPLSGAGRTDPRALPGAGQSGAGRRGPHQSRK